jgi:hypothetical protein
MTFISTFDELNKLYEANDLLQENVKTMSTKNRLNQKDSSLYHKMVTFDPTTGECTVGKDTTFEMTVYAVPNGSKEPLKALKSKLYTDSSNTNRENPAYTFEGSYTNIVDKLNTISKTHEIRKMSVKYKNVLNLISTEPGWAECFNATELLDQEPIKTVVGMNWVFAEDLPFMKPFIYGTKANRVSKTMLTEAMSRQQIEERLTEGSDDIFVKDDTVVEIPIEDDEPKQVICECDKCGALVIMDEADIVVDEESDLVNVKDKCKFCEEKEGYKIVGYMIPYEAADEEASQAEEAADVAIDEPVEAVDEMEDEDLLDEDLADWYRKKFDKPASTATQQSWEDELNGEMGEISDKRRKHLEKKFAQQRDWEKRHAEDDEELEELFNSTLEINPNINLTANGNEVAVGGATV